MTGTEARSLEEVLSDLGQAYAAWKTWGDDKDRHKNEFYDLANAAITERGLALKLIMYPGTTEEAARARAALHNPGWAVLESRQAGEGLYDVILEEDPALQAHSVELEDAKYSRQISRGPVLVDDGWLQEAEPELYAKVTVALPWGTRVMIPLEHLKPEQVSRLGKYIYNGTPRVQLRVQLPKGTE